MRAMRPVMLVAAGGLTALAGCAAPERVHVQAEGVTDLTLRDDEDKLRAVARYDPERERHEVRLIDVEGQDRALAAIRPDASGELRLLDDAGEARALAALGPTGLERMVLRDPDGRDRALVTLRPGDVAQVALFGEDGEEQGVLRIENERAALTMREAPEGFRAEAAPDIVEERRLDLEAPIADLQALVRRAREREHPMVFRGPDDAALAELVLDDEGRSALLALVTPRGEVRAVVGVTGAGATWLAVLDREERLQAGLHVPPEPDAPGYAFVFDLDGEVRAGARAGPGREALLGVYDARQRQRALVDLTEPEVRVLLGDPDARVLIGAP